MTDSTQQPWQVSTVAAHIPMSAQLHAELSAQGGGLYVGGGVIEGYDWHKLQSWIADNREERAVEIVVHANDPEYNDDGDTIVGQSFSYEITACDNLYYPSRRQGADTWDDNAMVFVNWRGYGDTLDAAASEVLRAMEEYRGEGGPT